MFNIIANTVLIIVIILNLIWISVAAFTKDFNLILHGAVLIITMMTLFYIK
jgi:hypothetical protein